MPIVLPELANRGAYNESDHLQLAPLNGGQVKTVAFSPHELQDNSTGDLRIAGWTTM